MRQRHYGHCSDIKNGIAGLGTWKWLDLQGKQNLEECMKSFSLVIVASVRPPATPDEQDACQARLERLEGDLQHRLTYLEKHGGMNVRDENR